jgi:diguanylate cyclase (GGDEF)-like protein
VVVPISTHDRLLGVVAAALPDTREAGDDDLVARLGGIASQGATALENARLLEQIHHQGLHDALSGLPNRHLFRTRIDKALERAARTGSPPAVIFVDLDHFKALNDTCGHEAGDKVIVAVAERMRRAVRSTDTVARLGGDEFAVILEGLTDASVDARRIADALVRAVSQPLVAMGRTIRISASAGAVLAGPNDDHDSLLRRADASMYLAKSMGRNRAVVDGTDVSWPGGAPPPD